MPFCSPSHPSAGVSPDLHKSLLWIKSGVSIHHPGAQGHLGILCFWRQLPKPETLPALPRQGLPPLQHALQITCENQHLPNTKLPLERSTAVPFSKNPFSWWGLEKTKLSGYNMAFMQQLSERDTSVVYRLTAC